MYPASTAPLSVSSGSTMGSPQSIRTSKASSCPTFGVSAAEANVRGGSSATSVRRQPAISSSGRLGTLTLITTGSVRQVGEHRLRHPGAHLGGAVPALVREHLVPALALHAEVGDRLAHRQAGDAAVAGREGRPHGAGVVDRPPRVGARVDPGDDEVEGARQRHRAGRT